MEINKIMISYWFRLKRRLLRSISTMTLVVAGRSFKVPFIDGLYCDVSEPWMLELQSRLLPQKSGTFVDVGMNVGQTLVVVKALDSMRTYIGFEPNPNCFFYCEKLTSLNELPCVSMLPVGVSSTSGIETLQLYSDNDFDSAASIVENFRPNNPVKGVKFVPVFNFSDITRHFPIINVGFIKIDVEGAELEVLQTMETIINADRPWIIIEILPCYSADNTSRIKRQELIEAMLSKLDYCILRIIKSPGNRFSHLEKIARFGIHDSLALSDYVLCPREDVGRVMSAVTDDLDGRA